jgi:hypothetical protein
MGVKFVTVGAGEIAATDGNDMRQDRMSRGQQALGNHFPFSQTPLYKENSSPTLLFGKHILTGLPSPTDLNSYSSSLDVVVLVGFLLLVGRFSTMMTSRNAATPTVPCESLVALNSLVD